MITITIETCNEAFQDGNRELEVARILQQLARQWYRGSGGFVLRDINGNTVGKVTLTGKDHGL